MKMFDRVIELRVGETEITGLDIAFEIEKDESPEPNPCHIEIYNLGPENRATLSTYKQVPVLLKAGYKDQVEIIFYGDMMRCAHLKEGVNWKTVLASGDGALAIQTKRIDKSYAKGTPLKTVVEDLAKQMRLSANNPLSHLEELNQTLSRSFIASGNPMAEVTRLLSSQHIRASVQNQGLQLRKKNQPLQKEAINLRSDTGLLASPEIGSKGTITIRSVLMPELQPGRRISIDSVTFQGLVIIEKVRFIGSNFGQEWEAELGCKVI